MLDYLASWIQLILQPVSYLVSNSAATKLTNNACEDPIEILNFALQALTQDTKVHVLQGRLNFYKREDAA